MMRPRIERALTVTLVAALGVAIFVLVWVAGPVLDLLLFITAVVTIGACYGFCRFFLRRETAADRMARDAQKNSGRHPAGRGRVTNPADAAPLTPLDTAAVVAEPDGDLLATRSGWLSGDEIYDLLATTDPRHWWAWRDSLTPKTRKLTAKLHRRALKAQRRGRR